MKLKFWIDYCERRDEHRHAFALVLNTLPEIGDHLSIVYDNEIVESVRPVIIDCEQPTRDVFLYDIYEIEISDAENPEDIDWAYIAVPNMNTEEE